MCDHLMQRHNKLDLKNMQIQTTLLQTEMNQSRKYFVNSFNTVWVVNVKANVVVFIGRRLLWENDRDGNVILNKTVGEEPTITGTRLMIRCSGDCCQCYQ
jgi:hypothetical protein